RENVHYPQFGRTGTSEPTWALDPGERRASPSLKKKYDELRRMERNYAVLAESGDAPEAASAQAEEHARRSRAYARRADLLGINFPSLDPGRMFSDWFLPVDGTRGTG